MPPVKLTPRLINFVPVGFVLNPANAVSIDPVNADISPEIKAEDDSKGYALPLVEIPA